jgi:rhodanese-related sulfurtransferase
VPKSIFWILTNLAAALLLSACGPGQAEVQSGAPSGEQNAEQPAITITSEGSTASGEGYTKISATELQAMLAQKDFIFVNVHIPFEGDIAGTDLSIPYDQIEQQLSQLPADRGAKIVLYCRSGRMSTIAAEDLVELGFNNIFELEGGMLEWEKVGFPLVGKQ